MIHGRQFWIICFISLTGVLLFVCFIDFNKDIKVMLKAHYAGIATVMQTLATIIGVYYALATLSIATWRRNYERIAGELGDVATTLNENIGRNYMNQTEIDEAIVRTRNILKRHRHRIPPRARKAADVFLSYLSKLDPWPYSHARTRAIFERLEILNTSIKDGFVELYGQLN